mmetsp:Transcript_29634/g.43802  ORF Transcript_29634/g.43802 Transcript_29634/m.43802 type:complete len:267 (+) Transcript_29634:121-921(+)
MRLFDPHLLNLFGSYYFEIIRQVESAFDETLLNGNLQGVLTALVADFGVGVFPYQHVDYFFVAIVRGQMERSMANVRLFVDFAVSIKQLFHNCGMSEPRRNVKRRFAILIHSVHIHLFSVQQQFYDGRISKHGGGVKVGVSPFTGLIRIGTTLEQKMNDISMSVQTSSVKRGNAHNRIDRVRFGSTRFQQPFDFFRVSVPTSFPQGCGLSIHFFDELWNQFLPNIFQVVVLINATSILSYHLFDALAGSNIICRSIFFIKHIILCW